MASYPKIHKVDIDNFTERYNEVCAVFQEHFAGHPQLNLEQLCEIFQLLDSKMTRPQLESLWDQLDRDKSGDISITELLWYLFDLDSHESAIFEDFKGLVKAGVFCRIRPFGADGHAMGEEVEKQLDGWTNESIIVKDRHERTEYTFPKQVLGPECSQEDTYQAIMSDIVDGWLMNCMNVMLLAYGQTGTGKTHTMFGPRESLSSTDVHPDWGLFPRAVHKCLEIAGAYTNMDHLHGGATFSLRAHAVEFYLGSAYDLIPQNTPLEFDPAGFPLGANFVEIRSVSDLCPFLDMVNSNRTMSGTKMNAGSSRSHCALILSFVDVGAYKEAPTDVKYLKRSLTVLDMAGSERPGKTGAERIGPLNIAELMRKTDNGKNMTKAQRNGMEGGVINSELTALKDEIALAADQNQGKIKYKNLCFGAHPLLRMVGRSMCGQCWMNAVICLSQSPQNGWETWFSCEYAKGLAKLQSPLKKVKLEDADEVQKRLVNAVANAKKVFERTPETGSPASKYWSRRKAMVKHTADELELLEQLLATMAAKNKS